MEKSLLFEVRRTLYMCLFMSVLTGLCGGCGGDSSSDDPTPPLVKSLTAGPSSLKFGADGAAKELTVTAQNVDWTATPADAWVHLSVTSGSASAAIQVTLDPNESELVLTSSIVVSAEGVEPVTIRVEQEAKTDIPGPDPEDAIMLRTVEGYWAGDYWGTDGALDDVYLVMTDMETSGDKLVPPGYVISLDMNIPAATFDTFDIAGTYAPSMALTPVQRFTFNSDEVSYVVTYDADGNKVAQRYTTGGNVEITRSGDTYAIELTFTLDDESTFKAKYDGEIAFFDDTRKYISTLTGNCTPSLATAEGAFQKYSQPEVTASLCVLNLFGDRTTPSIDNMQLFLNVAPAAEQTGAIEGEYTILEDMENIPLANLVPGTAIPGYLSKNAEGNLSFMGSWYRKFVQDAGEVQLGGMAPFVSGSVTVARVDKEYTLTYSFTDDNESTPHTISGTYTGAIEFGLNPDPDPDPDLTDVTAGGNLGQWKPGGRW